MLITKLSQMSGIEILIRWRSRSLGASIFTLGIFSGLTIPASAQIIYEGGKVAPLTGKTIDIPVSEGKPTPAGTNLFHSFDKFNVNAGETANFISTPNIQNILGRVNGANGGSLIDGTLQVTGSNANLFLMNPAGIVFGKGASLDINGTFTATTAKAIDFNGKWFNAVGTNNYTELTGNPLGLAFTGGTPGSIFNASTLSNVQPGKSITLVGGTVISTGDIKTAGGNISIATVEGGKYVQIKADGSLLRLDLPASTSSIAKEATAFTPLKLAELLTNPTLAFAATGVTNKNGVITLVGDNRSILPGDIVTQKLTTSGNPNGGKVSLNTQAGDIIVSAVDTSSQDFGGGNGGDVTINAGGIFRATGFVDGAANISATDKDGKPVSGVSIFTGGNRDSTNNVAEKDLRGGKININYQGKLFVVGGEAIVDPNSFNISVILTQPFIFPAGASGAVGAIISRNSNGNIRVVLKDGIFTNQDGSPAGGFGIAGGPVIPRGGGGTTANPDQQASRPKSKENCTPSSTAVASNPTAAPTRSVGNSNTISADPCQSNPSNSEILQILTDRQ